MAVTHRVQLRRFCTLKVHESAQMIRDVLMYKVFLMPAACVLLASALSAQAADGRSDYDLDDNGLIELNDLADLDAVRHYPDGSALYGSSAGCPAAGCRGFELTADLNFDTDANGVMDAADTFWNDAQGWQPLGTPSAPFTALFDGRGHEILNLYIDRPAEQRVGLFGEVRDADIRNLGLSGALMSVRGDDRVGALAGNISNSAVQASYSEGLVSGREHAGGLIGYAFGSEILATYATGPVSGHKYIGGLLGYASEGSVSASYSTASVSAGKRAGGLIGFTYKHVVSASYSAGPVKAGNEEAGLVGYSYGSEIIDSVWINTLTAADGNGLAELQCPVSAGSGNCGTQTLYQGWDRYAYQNAAGHLVRYWDFGDNTQLPGLNLSGRIHRDGNADGNTDEAVLLLNHTASGE